MLKLRPLGFALLQTFCFISFPAVAQASQIELDAPCRSTLEATQTQLQRTGNLSVRMRTIDQSQYSDDFPTNRPISVQLILDGKSAASVMNSSQLMKSISTKIIQDCQSVSVVIFGVNRSGWYTTYGLFDQNRVEEFQCFEFVRGRKMPYGYQNCDV